jgi:hypothetical protein
MERDGIEWVCEQFGYAGRLRDGKRDGEIE